MAEAWVVSGWLPVELSSESSMGTLDALWSHHMCLEENQQRCNKKGAQDAIAVCYLTACLSFPMSEPWRDACAHLCC